MRGFGHPQLANPPSAVPSSWHDVNGSQPRYEGSTNNILTISAQLSMMLSHSPPISPREYPAPPTSCNYDNKACCVCKLVYKVDFNKLNWPETVPLHVCVTTCFTKQFRTAV